MPMPVSSSRDSEHARRRRCSRWSARRARSPPRSSSRRAARAPSRRAGRRGSASPSDSALTPNTLPARERDQHAEHGRADLLDAAPQRAVDGRVHGQQRRPRGEERLLDVEHVDREHPGDRPPRATVLTICDAFVHPTGSRSRARMPSHRRLSACAPASPLCSSPPPSWPAAAARRCPTTRRAAPSITRAVGLASWRPVFTGRPDATGEAAGAQPPAPVPGGHYAEDRRRRGLRPLTAATTSAARSWSRGLTAAGCGRSRPTPSARRARAEPNAPTRAIPHCLQTAASSPSRTISAPSSTTRSTTPASHARLYGDGLRQVTRPPARTADGHEPNGRRTASGSSSCAWILDGHNQFVRQAIYTVKVDGSSLRDRAVPLVAGDGPDWSPDGSRILFRSPENEDFLHSSCTRSAPTGALKQVTHVPDGTILFGVVLVPTAGGSRSASRARAARRTSRRCARTGATCDRSPARLSATALRIGAGATADCPRGGTRVRRPPRGRGRPGERCGGPPVPDDATSRAQIVRTVLAWHRYQADGPEGGCALLTKRPATHRAATTAPPRSSATRRSRPDPPGAARHQGGLGDDHRRQGDGVTHTTATTGGVTRKTPPARSPCLRAAGAAVEPPLGATLAGAPRAAGGARRCRAAPRRGACARAPASTRGSSSCSARRRRRRRRGRRAGRARGDDLGEARCRGTAGRRRRRRRSRPAARPSATASRYTGRRSGSPS